MFQVALSYEVAGSSGAGLSFVISMLSVVPTTMGLPLSPLPPPELPHPLIRGVRTPRRAGSTRSLRFIVVVLLLLLLKCRWAPVVTPRNRTGRLHTGVRGRFRAGTADAFGCGLPCRAEVTAGIPAHSARTLRRRYRDCV